MSYFARLLALCALLLATIGGISPAQCIYFDSFAPPTNAVYLCGASSLETPGFFPVIEQPTNAPPSTYTQTHSFSFYSLATPTPLVVTDWYAVGMQDRLVMRTVFPSTYLTLEGIDTISYKPTNATPGHPALVSVWVWLQGASTLPVPSPYGTWANPDPTASFVTQFETYSNQWLQNPNVFGWVYYGGSTVLSSGSFGWMVGQTVNIQVMMQVPSSIPGESPLLIFGPVETITVV